MLKIRWNWKKRLDLLIRCWNSNTHLKVRLHLVAFVNDIQLTSESMLIVGGVLFVCFVFVFCYFVKIKKCYLYMWADVCAGHSYGSQRLTCGNIPNSGHQVWVAGVFTQ